jgi:hypothetical protein
MRRAATLVAALILLPSSFCLSSPPALRWTADVARPAPAEWTLLRGETRLLQPTVQEGRTPLAWPSNTVATLYWQTNGMAAAWWTVPASLGASAGQLGAVWSATNDVGASAYAFFLGAETPDGRTYSAHGTIRYRHGPGATPNALPLPVARLDFAALSVTNAPWATPAALHSASNALAEALQDAVAPLSTTQDLAEAIAAIPEGVTPGQVAAALTNAHDYADAAASNAVAAAASDRHAWSATGAVMRATEAARLRDGDGGVEWDGGTNWWTVAMTDETVAVVTAADIEPGTSGPSEGTTFSAWEWDDPSATWTSTAGTSPWYMQLAGSPDDVLLATNPVVQTAEILPDPPGYFVSAGSLPIVLEDMNGSASTISVQWRQVAVRAPLATMPYVDARVAAASWPSMDVATNLTWTTTISNGHYIAVGTPVSP